MYVTHLSGGDAVLAVTNWRAVSAEEIYFDLKTLGVKLNNGEKLHIRDLWAQKDVGLFSQEQAKSQLLIEKIPPHGTKVYRFDIVKE